MPSARSSRATQPSPPPAGAPEPEHLHFLLLPAFSVMGFVSAIEPLRVANRFRPGSYRWHILSLDGGPVVSSNGMSINADGVFTSAAQVRTVFVVAGFDPLAHYRAGLATWLRAQRRHGAVLGALDTGAFVLAEAGLLDAEPVTLHWEAQSAFTERYPTLPVTGELFEIGRQVISCAGGTAAIDLMLARITQAHGRALAMQVSEQFVLGRVRSRGDHQRMEIATRYGLHNRKLVQVVQHMREHIEDPLSADDLAAMVSVTRRQLERLFSTHLQDTPTRFYTGVRLERARELLQQTDMGILDIGVACGFRASAHFSRAYRARFGCSPKEERGRHGFSGPAPQK